MGDNKGDTTKKPSQQQQQSQTQNQQQQQQQQISSSSPKDHQLEDHHQSTISAPLFIPGGATSSSPFDQVQFDQTATNNPKRARYTAGQWKLLPSPSSQAKLVAVQGQMTVLPSNESSPSPTTYPPAATANIIPAPQPPNTAASSSDTASSPSQSLPERPAEGGESNPVHQHQQLRKGKYVSPVWKPNEMLWLARAWRVQYQTGSSSSSSRPVSDHPSADIGTGQAKGKTRADKDKEVAEFLQRHGVNRDAKTAGTKWDNMLGEFRKVYEWERGGEREQVGKSYFRLSPYERKLHRLPASFDEEVFEELSQFMGSRMRTSSSSTPPPQSRSAGLISGTIVNLSGGEDSLNRSRSLTAPSSFKEDDLQFPLSARTKQLVLASGGGEAYYSYGGRSSGTASMGFEQGTGETNVIVGPSPPSSSSSKELRRIGKVRMTWEESVSLWGEEGESQRGRVKLVGGSLSFLNADELTYFDDAMVGSTMEGFEEGPLKGFSVDRFVPGQQVKVFGRKKALSVLASEKVTQQQQHQQLPFTEPSIRSIPPWEYQDPTEYYVGCLRILPPSIPSLFELSWYLQEPPPEELRFPLRKDVYRDLPQGRELFFTISNELLDCRAITYDLLSPIIRTNPCLTSATATGRDSFIGLWDDCINRIVSKFCSVEMTFIRKPTISSSITITDDDQVLQDQWPNVTGFVRNLCLWRGEETDQLREGQIDPSNSIVEKLLWTYSDLPYLLSYYAVGFLVTFCALSRAQDRIIRTDLQTLDLSSQSDRLKALVPCYRIAGLLPLLADRCLNGVTNSSKMLIYSDFERVDNNNITGNGNVTEMTPNTATRFYPNRRKWTAVKEIYDFLDHRIPHAEFIHRSSETDLSLVFKPRGIKSKPQTCEQLVEALKYVTKALVALHDLSFMHRDLSWDKVMRRVTERGESEWFVCGFEEAVGAPQIYPHHAAAASRGAHAPEMERGLHGVKVDVWGVGNLVRTCFGGTAATATAVPKMLRELQQRCLEQNPEQRPTAADCYHHLLQLQSSLQAVSASASGGGGVVI